jgi:hypothetical protein
VNDEEIMVHITMRIHLNWIDSRIYLPLNTSASYRPMALTLNQRNDIWIPELMTTFRTRIPAETIRNESDYVAVFLTLVKKISKKLQFARFNDIIGPRTRRMFRLRLSLK